MDNYPLLNNQESASIASRVNFQGVSAREFLVTGASGMIGAYTVQSLIECCILQGLEPPKFTLLSRNLNSGNISMFSRMPNVRIIETELVEWKVDRSFDYLIHAASPASPTKYKSPESIVQSNLGFLESLREQCLPPSVLFISSGEVYGSSPPLYVDESYNSAVIPRSARSVYPEAKISTERLLQEMKRDGLTSPLIVRLFHSFGPGLRVNDGRSFGDFLWSAAHAENLSLLSSGSSIRTFLYIEDAVAGLLTVLTKGIPGEPYNIGSDKPMAISEFADLVARIAGVEVLYPATSLETRDDYVHSPNLMVVPSLEKAVNLGWRPMVELGKGVERTLDWIRSVSR